MSNSSSQSCNKVVSIDLLQKIITRTDGFHNYANTKSTIIITFITALFVGILSNASKIFLLPDVSNCITLQVIFKVLLLISGVLLVLAFYCVGKTVVPYIEPSEKINIYSFIDVTNGYETECGYLDSLERITEEELIASLASLQFNLSKGLVAKYTYHRHAIFYIVGAIVPLLIIVFVTLFMV